MLMKGESFQHVTRGLERDPVKLLDFISEKCILIL
jgi:hypothetical protein